MDRQFIRVHPGETYNKVRREIQIGRLFSRARENDSLKLMNQRRKEGFAVFFSFLCLLGQLVFSFVFLEKHLVYTTCQFLFIGTKVIGRESVFALL